MSTRRRTALLALVLAVAAPAWAGTVIKIETADLTVDPPAKQYAKMLLDGSKVSVVPMDARTGGHVIFRGDRELMWVVDEANRRYMQFDRDAVEAMGGQMDKAMKMVDAKLAGLPPEQRAMMQKMLEGRMPGAAPAVPATTVKKTGVRKKMRNHECAQYEVFRGDTKVREIWAADWSVFAQARPAFAVFDEMEAFQRGMLESMKRLPGVGEVESPYSGLGEIDGFPLVLREFADGRVVRETTFVDMEAQDLDYVVFEPPAGYKLYDPAAALGSVVPGD